jgi:hypothetical protein
MTSGFTLHENVHEANVVAIFQLSQPPLTSSNMYQRAVRCLSTGFDAIAQ